MKWIFKGQANGREPKVLLSWARELQVSPFLTRLLWKRGLSSLEEMDVFLSPGLRHLPPLETWPELEQAASHLASCLLSGKTLAVWGDYDVDGLTSTAIVVDFLTQRGMKVIAYVPQRVSEGYGLNLQGLECLKAQGVQCLLTVDCGITNVQEIARAKELGLDVVVTDHHLPGESLPPADALVNPRANPVPVYKELAGVGVTFLLMAALNRKLAGSPTDMRQYLDLVALGTIADVVDLRGENRILVKNGLLLLSEGKRPGIFALKEASNLSPTARLGSGQVSFGLAPRLNAAGRVGSPELALKLLLAKDLSTARPLAAQLEKLNAERRTLEQGVLAEALEQARNFMENKGLVLYGPDWHPGIIGIVASRIVEQLHRPTLLLTRINGLLKGSGRSIKEFNLYEGLASCADLLEGFGGHPLAAGLSLQEECLDPLRKRFHQVVQDVLGDDLPEPGLFLEDKVGLDMVDLQLVKEIELLQPFGPGNPTPLFCSPPLAVREHKIFGQDHLSLLLQDKCSGKSMWGKAWRKAGKFQADLTGQRVQLAYTPRINNYNGLTSIDLQISDLKVVSEPS